MLSQRREMMHIYFLYKISTTRANKSLFCFKVPLGADRLLHPARVFWCRVSEMGFCTNNPRPRSNALGADFRLIHRLDLQQNYLSLASYINHSVIQELLTSFEAGHSEK